MLRADLSTAHPQPDVEACTLVFAAACDASTVLVGHHLVLLGDNGQPLPTLKGVTFRSKGVPRPHKARRGCRVRRKR